MKKFLSLIVVLMLAFGVKAQTIAPDFNCVDDYGKKVHLYDILDNNHYAFLYFFIPDTEDQEGQDAARLQLNRLTLMLYRNSQTRSRPSVTLFTELIPYSNWIQSGC